MSLVQEVKHSIIGFILKESQESAN